MLKQTAWNERRVQDEIADNPEWLGVPAHWLAKQEHSQGGPRVDILFRDPAGQDAVLVEIQLGRVDRYHLAKTLEYLHRRRDAWPNAVSSCILIAETFAGRNGRLAEAVARVLPLRLVELAVLEDRLVLKEHNLPQIGDAPPEEADHAPQWTKRPWFPLAQSLFDVTRELAPFWSPKFNTDFIGGKRREGAHNFFGIKGQRDPSFHIELKLEESEDVSDKLRAAGFVPNYRGTGDFRGDRRRHYWIEIEASRTAAELKPLHELIAQAYHRWETLD